MKIPLPILAPIAAAISLLASGSAFATSYHFCDCGSGASSSPSCSGAIGNDTTGSGLTPSSPWRTWSKFTTAWAAGVPGDRFKFCRGGAWNSAHVEGAVRNGSLASYISSPMYAEAYDHPSMVSAAKPRLNLVNSGCVDFDSVNCTGFFVLSTAAYGGYVIQGLHFDGASGIATQGVSFRSNANYIQILDNDFTNVEAAGGCQSWPGGQPKNIIWRGNYIADTGRNTLNSFGCSLVLIEANQFINASSWPMGYEAKIRDHPIYASGDEQNNNLPAFGVTIRNNYFKDWGHGINDISGASAKCGTAAITGHSEIADWVVEGNRFEVSTGAAIGFCWGVGIRPGNFDAGKLEYEKGYTVRNNWFANVTVGVSVASCQRCTIENNSWAYETSTADNFIAFDVYEDAAHPLTSGPNSDITVRNNSCYAVGASDEGRCYRFQPGGSATNFRFYNNSCTFGAGAASGRYCFDVAAASKFSVFDYNHGFGFTQWAIGYNTRLDFANARSQDTHSCSATANFAAIPTIANSLAFDVLSPSCLIDGGHPTLSPRLSRDGLPAVGQRDIGAREFRP